MKASEDRPFKVSSSALARSNLRELCSRAKARGQGEVVAAAVRTVIERLETDPLQLGEPKSNLPVMGLVMCVGVVGPLAVQFAVDEKNRIVYIKEFRPLPRRGLDPEE
jgi:hypothetical protein